MQGDQLQECKGITRLAPPPLLPLVEPHQTHLRSGQGCWELPLRQAEMTVPPSKKGILVGVPSEAKALGAGNLSGR